MIFQFFVEDLSRTRGIFPLFHTRNIVYFAFATHPELRWYQNLIMLLGLGTVYQKNDKDILG